MRNLHLGFSSRGVTPWILMVVTFLFSRSPIRAEDIYAAQGSITGEVTSSSAILQSRLTASNAMVDGDVPGTSGFAQFEYSEDHNYRNSRKTAWIRAQPEHDFVIQAKISNLKPSTKYYYRFHFGLSKDQTQIAETSSFQTLQGATGKADVSFVVVTGMNYVSFHYGPKRQGKRVKELSYQGADKQLGYPALASIRKLAPDFFVGTGDNVYYDSKDEMHAETIADMRRKWHEQFVQPRFVELFRDVPTYWEKDDHDHRYNDCDCAGDKLPGSDLGIRIFREQVPVVDPKDPHSKTYRTHRINRHLQIWLVEGRDFRSPHKMLDGPGKTLWGAEQLKWLKTTLLGSDATFKILISPTPLVGPDDAYKIDNHTNHKGFRHEGREFFRWIKQQKLDQRGFFIVCGDRHWQYHSIDPTGIEEFSCGALCDSNSRIGRVPGDPKSTDPDAKVQQVYTQSEPSGGFLRVVVSENTLHGSAVREAEKSNGGVTEQVKNATAHFEFYDENSRLLHRSTKRRNDPLQLLGDAAPKLLHDHLLGKIRQQYASRRASVTAALRSRDKMANHQQRLRASLQRMIGELPKIKTPLNAKVTGVIDDDDYRIEKLVFESRPSFFVTANLYVPKMGQPPFPGVLIACGHSQHGKSYEPYQRVGSLMAKQGLVALVYDPVGQGERRQFETVSPNAGLQHKLANTNSILLGRTIVGYQVWDGVRAIDYLLSRPDVNRTLAVGMTGNSGGGAQTMYLMAFDSRIGPAAPSCHITTLERNFELGSAGDGCQSPPGTGAEKIDHPDFFTMRAPRPTIILSAEQDYKDIRFTRKTFAECQKVYSLFQKPNQIAMFAYDDKHSFSRPRREAAVHWMRYWLLDESDPIVETDFTTHAKERLQVTKSGQVHTEFSKALSISDLNLRRARELAKQRSRWHAYDLEAARLQILKSLGIDMPKTSCSIEHQGIVNRGDYRVEKLILRRDDEVPVAALLYRPHILEAKAPVTVYLDSRGKTADAYDDGPIEQLLSQGHVVMSMDIRGWGEMVAPPNSIVYSQGDHIAAMWSLHIGHSLLGQRVEDVLTAITCLPQYNLQSSPIHFVGVEHAGPIALHAGVLSRDGGSVTLRDSILSWIDGVVAQPTNMHAISHVVPSALKTYDLADLAKLLGSRLTLDEKP